MKKNLFNAIACLLFGAFVSSSSAMLNLGAAGGGGGIPNCAISYGGNISEAGPGEGATDGLIACSYTHTDPTCIVNTIESYVKYDAEAGRWIKAGIYDDDAGDTEPLNLLAQQDAPAAVAIGWDWQGDALDSEITLTQGSTYWLGNIPDANRWYKYTEVANTLSEGCGGNCTYAENMTDPWEDGSSDPYTRCPAIRVRYN